MKLFIKNPISALNKYLLQPIMALSPRKATPSPPPTHKKYIKMPQKAKYRMRAHINPLTEIAIP